MSGRQFPEPVQVEIKYVFKSDLHPYKVITEDKDVYYCNDSQLFKRRAKALKSEEVAVPESVRIQAEELAEKRMEELKKPVPVVQTGKDEDKKRIEDKMDNIKQNDLLTHEDIPTFEKIKTQFNALKATTLPTFEEVYEDFKAIISLDREKSVAGDRTRVIELAKLALFQKIKNGVIE